MTTGTSSKRRRPWRLEYARVARWECLSTYSTREKAEAQKERQLERYPGASYRVVFEARA